MPTPTLTFEQLTAELGCHFEPFPGGGLQVFLPRESRGQFDRRFWDLSNAHVAGTLSGPALHVVLHDDFATIAAGAFLRERDPAAASQMGFEEERDALAELIRARFSGLVALALEIWNSGTDLPHGFAGRLSRELARCDARGITRPPNPTPLADARAAIESGNKHEIRATLETLQSLLAEESATHTILCEQMTANQKLPTADERNAAGFPRLYVKTTAAQGRIARLREAIDALRSLARD